jgi:hypothetical protein
MTDDKVVARACEHSLPAIDYGVELEGDGGGYATSQAGRQAPGLVPGRSSGVIQRPGGHDGATRTRFIRGDPMAQRAAALPGRHRVRPLATERVALGGECGPGGPDARAVADQGAPIATD